MREPIVFLCAGVEGAPTIWLFLTDNHYQLVIPQEEMILMRPELDGNLVRHDTQAEMYFLLPSGVFS